MFILSITILCILIALARGGRLANLALLPVRFIGLLFLPFVLQLIAFSPIGDRLVLGIPLARYLYTVSLGVAVIVLWLNRKLPGVVLITLGLCLNFLVIALNGGFMPVSASAREFAGLPPLTGRDNNVIPLTDSSWLPWLSDTLPLPAFVPFANVFSPGDLLIVIGGIIFTQRALVPPQSGATKPLN
ncbi:MAG TPA: DUF5317 domain-containing protein [Anaerolineae bacterium]|nr:DUF5317 domain-containing protein [Anaerolineae bacterium]